MPGGSLRFAQVIDYTHRLFGSEQFLPRFPVQGDQFLAEVTRKPDPSREFLTGHLRCRFGEIA